jgi:GTP cyclohydrolase FolE2
MASETSSHSPSSFRTRLVDLLEIISHDSEYDSQLPRREYIEKIYSQQIDSLCKEIEELKVTLEAYKNHIAATYKGFGN